MTDICFVKIIIYTFYNIIVHSIVVDVIVIMLLYLLYIILWSSADDNYTGAKYTHTFLWELPAHIDR